MTEAFPSSAMVLAAGLGTRMRPMTLTLPKPLIRIGGRTLLDRGLDALAASGVERAVVNIHHLGHLVREHLATRSSPRIIISDESDGLLDSAGGIVKALPLLGPDPFYVLNADTFWIDTEQRDLDRLALAWDAGRMDILLMLAGFEQATGHSGRSDFLVDDDGRLRRSAGHATGLIYAGAAILHPRIFADASPGMASLNRYFDAAIETGRLYGKQMAGRWITVGTPESIVPAEAAVRAASAARSVR